MAVQTHLKMVEHISLFPRRIIKEEEEEVSQGSLRHSGVRPSAHRSVDQQTLPPLQRVCHGNLGKW
jgi:hypothetical protein